MTRAGLTPLRLAERELKLSHGECFGELEVDERDIVTAYQNHRGYRTGFDPHWNAFDHPIHDLPHDEGEALAVSALYIVTGALIAEWGYPVNYERNAI